MHATLEQVGDCVCRNRSFKSTGVENISSIKSHLVGSDPSMAISTRFLLLLSFLCCSSQTACAVTQAVRMDPCHQSDSMYQNGSHSVSLEPVGVKKGRALCCSLLVAIPKDAGSYPVVQFQHGFLLRNADYKGLITQVASWGFIVVAPQMYATTDITANVNTEITNARSILNWMKTGLLESLPRTYANHTPEFDKVALAGHSRGGLVVFGLALNYGNAVQNYSAVVGLDPVDGTAPSILTHKENSMDVGVPTLIVGTGFGSQKKGGLLPPCAPEYQGHINFYKDLTPASFHFVATKNGHMDFTEDCSWWDTFNPLVVRCKPLCVDGLFPRQCLRQFSAGIMVAFLQDVLFQKNTTFLAALNQSAVAPVDLDPPESKGNISRTSEAHHQYADMASHGTCKLDRGLW